MKHEVTTAPIQLLPARDPHQRSWVNLHVPDDAPDRVYVSIDNPAPQVGDCFVLNPGDSMTVENTNLSKPASKAFFAITETGTSSEIIVIEGV